MGLLPALRADVRQRRARHRGRALRGRDQARQGRPRRQGRHRARRRGAAGAHAQLQGALRVPAPTRASSSSRRSGPSSTPGTASAPSTYRRINRIPDDWGTAVNVQQMVFGNKGDDSGSGVAFSRDEVTGAPRAQRRLPHQRPGRGRRLGRAQHAATSPSSTTWLPEVHAQLMEILRELERHYGDMQDTEFTVEEGRLYMLQTRNAKRPAQAAVRFAVDAVERGAARQGRRRWRRSTPRRSTRCCTRPSTRRPSTTCWPRGVAASPGAAIGRDRLHRRRRGGRRPPTGAT